MRICLHLGFHKTGSTSVQALLRANVDRLPEGIAALAQGDEGLRPLEDLCRACDAGRADLRAVEEGARALAAGMAARGPTVWLVSSEDLLGRIPSNRDGRPVYDSAPAIVSALARGFGGARVEATLYLRDHAPWVDSLFRHLLRTRGARVTAEDFAALPKFAPGCLPAAAARLAAAAPFPLRVLWFEDDLGTPPGPGRGWLVASGLTPDDLARLRPVPRQNPGIGADDVAFMARPLMMALPRHLRKAILTRRLRRQT